jgi:Ribonuclease G/E
MSTEIFINVAPGETRLALVEDGRLVEYVNSRIGPRSLLGAVYLGRVANVSKALDAAFVDLGLERPGLLAFGDAKEGTPKLVEGAPVLVQVTRDATDDKGPKLSGKIDHAAPSDLRAPAIVSAAPDPVAQFLETRVGPGWRVICDAPRSGAEVRRATSPIFAEHDIDAQLDAALQPVVPLGDGASLVIEETAALVAIDVNSGPRGAPYGVNLAAVGEIARQLRLRNLAGQIFIDFLPVKGRERREQLVAALRGAVADDPCEVHVLGLTRLGLAELTRRRVGESLAVRLGYRTIAVRSAESAAFDLLREIDEQAKGSGARRFTPAISPAIETLLKSALREVLEDLNRRHALQMTWTIDAALAPGEFRL